MYRIIQNNHLLSFFSIFIYFFASTILTMEENQSIKSTVHIIDENMNDVLKDSITHHESNINIFGGTPRITRFIQYNEILNNHLSQLNKMYNKSKRMKGVDYKVKDIYLSLTKNENIHKQLNQPDLNRFFFLGIKQNMFEDNLKKLLICATSPCQNNYLIHVLLPCYFNDVKPLLENGSLTYDAIKEFLQASGVYLKNKYLALTQNIDGENQQASHVRILIPSIEYFKKFITSIEPNNKQVDYQSIEKDAKDTTIINTLDATIFKKLADHPHNYSLINPNSKGVKIVADTLARSYPKLSINIRILPLQDRLSTRFVTTFIPYLLKANKDYTKLAQQSPLITKELREYAENKEENNNV